MSSPTAPPLSLSISLSQTTCHGQSGSIGYSAAGLTHPIQQRGPAGWPGVPSCRGQRACSPFWPRTYSPTPLSWLCPMRWRRRCCCCASGAAGARRARSRSGCPAAVGPFAAAPEERRVPTVSKTVQPSLKGEPLARGSHGFQNGRNDSFLISQTPQHRKFSAPSATHTLKYRGHDVSREGCQGCRREAPREEDREPLAQRTAPVASFERARHQLPTAISHVQVPCLTRTIVPCGGTATRGPA